MSKRKLFLSYQRFLVLIGREEFQEIGNELFCIERTRGFVTVMSPELLREAYWPAKTTQTIAIDLAMTARDVILRASTNNRAQWRSHVNHDSDHATGITREEIIAFLARHDMTLEIPDNKQCVSHSELVDLVRDQFLPIEVIW
jgi:hypothetical protein